MAEHSLKCWPDEFAAVLDGSKTHEYRRDDRGGYEVGDILVLREWFPTTIERQAEISATAPLQLTVRSGSYSGRELRRRVTHVLRGPAFGVAREYVVMSLAYAGSRDDLDVGEAIPLSEGGPGSRAYALEVLERPPGSNAVGEGIGFTPDVCGPYRVVLRACTCVGDTFLSECPVHFPVKGGFVP